MTSKTECDLTWLDKCPQCEEMKMIFHRPYTAVMNKDGTSRTPKPPDYCDECREQRMAQQEPAVRAAVERKLKELGL